jgi:hypothetical protein
MGNSNKRMKWHNLDKIHHINNSDVNDLSIDELIYAEKNECLFNKNVGKAATKRLNGMRGYFGGQLTIINP